MATHSSVLAWRIPGTGDPGGLPSMESHRVGHVNRSSVENAFRHPKIIVLLLTGVEDGQTVRMPVGKREIFITFRVGALFARPLLGLCSRGEGAAQASYG